MVQGQDARSHEQHEEREVVYHLQERLVSSRRAEQVRQQKRDGHDQSRTERDDSRVVTIIERATRQVSAEIQRIVAEQGQTNDGYDLRPEETCELLTRPIRFPAGTHDFSQLQEAVGASQQSKIRHFTDETK